MPELLSLLTRYQTADELLDGMSAERLQQSLAARVVAHAVAERFGLPKSNIKKDTYGAPYRETGDAALSLTHTNGFAAAMISRSASCGIDIELPAERIRKIAPRVFSPDELLQAGNDLQRLTALWCAKEALYKWHKVGSLDFRTQLQIRIADENRLYGTIQVDHRILHIPLWQENFGKLVAVYCPM